MNVLILFKVAGRQLLKTKIVQGLFLLNLIVAFLAISLGQLTFAEQQRVALDMGAAAIHFCSIFFCIFVSGYYFSQDSEKQTYIPYLSRPVTRLQYLFAQFLSLLFFNFIVIVSQSAFLLILLKLKGFAIPSIYSVVFLGQILEAMLLLSFISFLSQWATVTTLLVVGFSTYLVGHWMESIPYFIEKSQNIFFKALLQFIQSAFFNLENLNWRPYLIYDSEFYKVPVFSNILYAFLWTFFFLFLSYQCFRRKSLG